LLQTSSVASDRKSGHQQFPEARKSQHSSGIPPCLFVNHHAKM
jgi:hypothetical protein